MAATSTALGSGYCKFGERGIVDRGIEEDLLDKVVECRIGHVIERLIREVPTQRLELTGQRRSPGGVDDDDVVVGTVDGELRKDLLLKCIVGLRIEHDVDAGLSLEIGNRQLDRLARPPRPWRRAC